MEGSLMGQALSHSQSVLASDSQFVGRITSILKDEGFSKAGEAAWTLAITISADVAAMPNVAEAYHAALLAGRESPAAADDVITDGLLLSAVTGVMNVLNAPEEG
jgi:hypothetical protein